MAEALRILHLADSHIGAQLVRRPRVKRLRRGDDIIASYRRVLERAVEHDVDLVIHAGDLFDTPAPSSAALAAATAPLLALAARGIPVVIVPGNHERSVIPGSLLLAHPLIHIAAEPTTMRMQLRGRDVAISAIPCIRRDSLAAFDAALAATGWRDAEAELRILATHQSFDGARCNSGTYRFRTSENVVSREAIPGEFHYVAAGHIHQQQVLMTPAGTPIVYAGSCDRVSFAERDESKGCMLLEMNGHGLQHRFVEHAVRPMHVVPIDVTGLQPGALRDALAAAVAALPEGAIAALRLTGMAPSGGLDGLRVSELVRARRDDVLVSVTMRDVQFEASGGPRRRARSAGAEAFKSLGDFANGSVRVEVDALATLPTGRGVYALYDGEGRLLYVGKATNLRTRVRTHVRARSSAAHFAGWSRRIAAVDVLPLGSDGEALLVEADLIRRLRPPFNRRMRSWRSYCYIVGGWAPHAQFQISDEPRGPVCFGPYRSRFAARELIDTLCARFGVALCPDESAADDLLPLLAEPQTLLCARFYAGQCSGPCADRVGPAEYADRVRRAQALLDGADESTVLAAEAEFERLAADSADDALLRTQRRAADVLRHAYEHGVRLRRAEALRGVCIRTTLGSIERVTLLTSSGPEFLRVPDDARKRREFEERLALRAEREKS
ncbi:MAG TPA: metallophosphoesterase family protein, partial [Phycisphaerae bacterium]|nr:metallophosphoesterase family protein [Phycisphaerae bacterium]